MENLTPKQIANRAYYARKSKAIREKKRQQYWQKKADDPNYRKPVSKPKPEAKPCLVVTPKQKSDSVNEKTIRQKIEDLKILKDLDVDVDSF